MVDTRPVRPTPRPRRVAPRPPTRRLVGGKQFELTHHQAQLIEVIELISTHFPTYAAQVSGVPATVDRLPALARAWAYWVHHERFEIEGALADESEVWRVRPMGELLDEIRQGGEAPGDWYYEALDVIVQRPNPTWRGLGLQVLIEQGYPDHDMFAVATWWLMAKTRIAPFDESTIAQLSPQGAEAMERLGFPQLPQWVDEAGFIQACQTIDINPRCRARLPGGKFPVRQLLGYALGLTGNPLLDVGEFEVAEVYLGSHDLEWDDLDQITAWEREAVPFVAMWSKLSDRYERRGYVWDDTSLGLKRLKADFEAIHREMMDAMDNYQPEDPRLVVILGTQL